MSVTKREYKKAGPDDKQKVTSKLNLQKARERKLELLKKAKGIEVEKTKPLVVESEPDSDSESSDEDVIVIAPKRKPQKKKKEEKESDPRKELNELKAMLAKKSNRKQPKKKQIINIHPAPAPVPEPPKDTGDALFKKLLLSQCN